MRRTAPYVVTWMLLVGLVMLAAGGINLIRIGLLNQLSGEPGQWWRMALGGAMTLAGTAYLGGFIHYRDKKRGRVKRPDWKS